MSESNAGKNEGSIAAASDSAQTLSSGISSAGGDGLPLRISLRILNLCEEAVAVFEPGFEAVRWANQSFIRMAQPHEEQKKARSEAILQFATDLLDSVAIAPGGLEVRPAAGVWQGRAVKLEPIESPSGALWVLLVGPNADDSRSDSPLVDAVTGICDRHALEAELAYRFGRAREKPFALLFVDLDGFKSVNDSLGHLAGDRTLRAVAQQLRHALRDEDLVARFGGDEFIVLIDGVTDLQGVEPIVERLAAAVEEPGPGKEPRGVSASIGVALSSAGYETPEQLIEAADRDMYARKRAAN